MSLSERSTTTRAGSLKPSDAARLVLLTFVGAFSVIVLAGEKCTFRRYCKRQNCVVRFSQWKVQAWPFDCGLFYESGDYLRIGETDGNGNYSSNIVTVCPIPFSNNVSSYLLYEDCHAWGGGRYLFSSYLSDHIVYRRCVGRTDAAITTHDGKNEPIGGVAIYGTSYAEVQNCIIVDSNSKAYWVYDSLPGALTCPNGSGTDVFWRGNIVLNSEMPAGGSANGFTGIVRENNIHWDVSDATIYGGTTTFSHNTIGVMKTSEANTVGINGYGSTITATNGIFYDLDGVYGAVYNVTSDYNYYYANSVNFSGGSSAGAHDVTNVNPLTASLIYLPRIESGTALDGVASDSGDVGATVLKKIGTSGTLYGESGYNTTTTDNLWPYPNEDIIKTNFRSYSNVNVSGTRGFCATGTQIDGTSPITLTSYIWEYLGNQMPTDIYGEPADPTCSDLTQNGDETGVDCGGSCPACSTPATGGMRVGAGTMRLGAGTMRVTPLQ